MALRRVSQLSACWVLLGTLSSAMPPAAFASQSHPNFLHGVGQVIGGVLFEFPKTVLSATLDGPPVVGTAVGLLAGTARALQVTVGGIVEMAAGFDPWGAKK